MLQPEDVFEVLEQANLPGTVDQHPELAPQAAARARALARRPAGGVAPADDGRAQRAEGRATGVAPVATYRLQFHKDFGFRDAIELVPYLAGLGISHLYASPFLKARPGSTHGYDVIDHNAVNPEIGTENELNQLIATLKKHGMGMVVDLVPNHMGVLHADNAWWLDVLEKGRASPYAKFFDIDWARGKLLLPVLGKHYGEALEELKLERDRKTGKWSVRYFDHRFPLNAKSQVGLKAAPKDTLALHRLLEKQYYRLAFWRVASDEINYRRFFEITDLAGLRMEDRTVFEATHGLVGTPGDRRRHRRRAHRPSRRPGRSEAVFRALARALFARRWIVLEKILADDEKLPEDWPVHGETGYRFANLLTGLFIDGAAEARFDRIYQRFTGERRTFEEHRAREPHAHHGDHARRRALHAVQLAGAHRRRQPLHARLHARAGCARRWRKSRRSFPVYRTYVSARGVSDTDRR